MKKLSDPRTTLQVVSAFDFDFRKRFGQNFLVDEGVILRSLEAAQVGKNDVIFEIGPGIGTLTQYLSEAAYKVVSIEIDKKLMPVLEQTLADCGNVVIINQDVLKVDMAQLARRYDAGRSTVPASIASSSSSASPAASVSVSDPAACASAPGHPLKIVANLPYYITTPILMNLFRQHIPAESVTVMVQKEVADRMSAEPGSKDYGSLSVAVQYYSSPAIVELVPPSSFIPHPKITSAVVKLDLYEEPPVRASDEDLFNSVVRAAFEQRRKTLVNALSSHASVPCSKEQASDALTRLGLDTSIRGEKLSLAQFVALSDCLKSMFT